MMAQSRRKKTPEELSAAGRKAAQQRHSLDTYVSSIERRADELTPELAARVLAAVAPIVDRAPKLTTE